jgi:hypothetical protein
MNKDPYLHKMPDFTENDLGEIQDELNVRGVFLKSSQSSEHFKKNYLLKFLVNSLLVAQ